MEYNPTDKALIQAFIQRESEDFNFKGVINNTTAEERKNSYLSSMLKHIEDELVKYTSADYISIQSLSNMGMLTRELKITPVQYSYGKVVELYLPNSPRGIVGSSIKDRFPKK